MEFFNIISEKKLWEYPDYLSVKSKPRIAMNSTRPENFQGLVQQLNISVF